MFVESNGMASRNKKWPKNKKNDLSQFFDRRFSNKKRSWNSQNKV